MSNVFLTLIPTSKDFQLLDVLIGGNGVADHRDLSLLHFPEEPDLQKGIILAGRGPIWLYTYLTHLCGRAAWVAVMDPRHGAIVIKGDGARPAGSTIPFEDFKEYLPANPHETRGPKDASRAGASIIGFVGPPHSGKSVLLRAVYSALQAALPIEKFQRDVFLVRACPDNEGNWFGEIPSQLAETLRHKGYWNDEFAAQASKFVEAIAKTKRLVLVDFGGKIDRYTQQILNRCSHGVIVSRDPSVISEWRGALKASEVLELAEVESVLRDACDMLSQQPLRLRLGPLERQREDISLPSELTKEIASLA
jgi:CRISPR-associated protein Csx3